MKSILIRYGELYLKGKNRHFFERCLLNNIENALKGHKFSLIKASGRFFVEDYDLEEERIIISKIIKVFGIHSVSPATLIETDLHAIYQTAFELSPTNGTFKVIVNRADKRLPINSMQIAREAGAYILSGKPELKVDIFNPEHEIFIDIRENGRTYILSEKIEGLGGMPVGSAGKGLLLLSGGIDSPVAAFMMAKRGMTINAIHFHSFPYTSVKAKEKVFDLAKIVSEYAGNIDLFVISLTEIQQEIHTKCPKEYMITIVRRFMLKLANIIAQRHKISVLITGESLGQVASQTIESISVISAVSPLQILRPLIGMDKSEIIKLAEKIGTYSTSIEPYEDCCTVFLPKNPVIKPDIKLIEQAEAMLDIDKLIENSLSTLEFVKIRN